MWSNRQPTDRQVGRFKCCRISNELAIKCSFCWGRVEAHNTPRYGLVGRSVKTPFSLRLRYISRHSLFIVLPSVDVCSCNCLCYLIYKAVNKQFAFGLQIIVCCRWEMKLFIDLRLLQTYFFKLFSSFC